MDIGSGTARRRSAAAAIVLGPTAVGLGLAAHVASGGAAPPVAVVLALTALVSLPGSAAARLPLPPWALGVGSGILQQALHLVFSALAGANAPLFPSAGHVHDHSAPLPTIPGSAETVYAPQDFHLMIVVHIAAALVTAALVTYALRTADRKPTPSKSEIPSPGTGQPTPPVSLHSC
ncbi:MAG: hypothetical protein HOQ07_06345 [Sinomonas sp.]|nr:hypothetical protein [Sinomonas sp.]